MSSFFICIIAFIARSDLADTPDFHISIAWIGTTCQDRPYLSLSQPHACASPVPEVVDLLLAVAVDDQRDRLVELELRASVERQELDAIQYEGHGQYPPLRLAVDVEAFLAEVSDRADARVLEDRDVVFRRVLGLFVEPQAGRDLLQVGHGILLNEQRRVPVRTRRCGRWLRRQGSNLRPGD